MNRVIVVSSAKIRKDLRHYLTEKYTELAFRFHTSMKEAEKDLTKADILITYGEDLDETLISRATNLKWIMVISAGLDRMPFTAIERQGIIVTNARGIHAIPMAEYTLSMMLQTGRQMKTLIENERQKEWDRSPVMTELHGKTIGILGIGAIGKEIARLAKAFNMTVIGLNRSGSPVENVDHVVTIKGLNSLLESSDFIVSVLPKLPETDDILRTPQFKVMKETAVLINIGRGNAINEDALLTALDEGEFKHVVLDVFKEEPLPANHLFWSHAKVTVTPHMSGISPQYQPRALDIFEHNLHVFLTSQGDYLNKIDPVKGY
ncbi:D-2-hydroxyacid dehydrogenase [Salipaludibacillus agaradhaerens]|uniref:D-2-hydroxyacid dehydrogenase n=1 Tax=Salipaludibacillus agaradhaerens TaxID=76935 RepID=UPI0023EF34C8|nr:D-2-hydroxyacid dehydrogenase [Salipaludibacillus agaradhaerens]